MAISLKTAGTWAELTADGAVTIPGSPAAGDRMFLFASWKDFSVTATVSGWTAIGAEFADGSVGVGNGTGSMKVQAWYRDWQTGDGNPTLDFSSSPNIAGAVIQLWQKASTDSWNDPTTVTAAWPATSTTQTVSASSATVVPSGSVVQALIGLRDDSATFTRATTTGIDVASGITWNGNYAESPATHLSTTTGFDMAADLGYRLVTTGGNVTLRVTATISATETGSVKWVIQGLGGRGFSQSQAQIKAIGIESFGQAQAQIKALGVNGFAQAQANIKALVASGTRTGAGDIVLSNLQGDDVVVVGSLGVSTISFTNATALQADQTFNGIFGSMRYRALVVTPGSTSVTITIGGTNPLIAHAMAFRAGAGQVYSLDVSTNADDITANGSTASLTYKLGQEVYLGFWGDSSGIVPTAGANYVLVNTTTTAQTLASEYTEKVTASQVVDFTHIATEWGIAAQTLIKVTRTNTFAQAQAQIKQTYRGYAQAQANIKGVGNAPAQAMARIGRTTYERILRGIAGLQSFWPMGEPPTFTTVNDYFGAVNGSRVGGPLSESSVNSNQIEPGVELLDTSQYILFADDYDYSAGITIIGWILASDASNSGTIIDKRSSSAIGWVVRYTANTVEPSFDGNTLSNSYVLNNNTWTFFAASYTNPNGRLDVENIKGTTTNLGTTVTNTATNLTIGKTSFVSASSINGAVSSIAIFDRTISYDDIQALYTVAKSGAIARPAQAQAQIKQTYNRFAQAQAVIRNDSTYDQSVKSDLPLSYWRLGESSGNPQDSVGTNHVTAVGGTPTYSVTGAVTGGNTAITFDGSTEYFETVDAPLDQLNGPLSWECWFKMAGTTGTNTVLLSKGGGTPILDINGFASGVVRFYARAVDLAVHSSVALPESIDWHHVVGTKDAANNWKLYLDGVDVTVVDASPSTVNSNALFTIGRDSSSNDAYFFGTIDEVAVYNSVLSLSRIQTHYSFKAVGVTTSRGYGQAQGNIKQTYNVFAQSQADIKQTYNTFAQAQSDIKQIYQGYAQAQARILQVYFGFAQAQAYIKVINIESVSQAQSFIAYNEFLDSFTRTTSNGVLGSADIGGAYRVNTNQEDTLFVNGNELEITGSNSDNFTAFLSQTITGQKGIYISFRVKVSNGSEDHALLFQVGGGGFNLSTVLASVNNWLLSVYEGTEHNLGTETNNQYITVKTWIVPTSENKTRIRYKDNSNIIHEELSDSEWFGPSYFNPLSISAFTASTTPQTIIVDDLIIQNWAWTEYGQAQAFIVKSAGYAQSQADIKQTYQSYAQSQSQIKQTYNAFAQAQAKILRAYTTYAQAQADIKQTYNSFAQAQADVKQTYTAYAQAQAKIKQTYNAFAQAQARILRTYTTYAQAQADILVTYNGFAQAQARILQVYNSFAQAQARILTTYYGLAQAQAKINAFGVNAFAQAIANIKGIDIEGVGQAQAKINAFAVKGYAQSQAQIKQTYNAFAQAQARILQTYNSFAQAQADILKTYNSFAQAQAQIKQTYQGYADAQADIKQTYRGYAQAQAEIKQTYQAYAQAQARILTTYQAYAQAQADILVTYQGYAQAQARMLRTYNSFAQAQAQIKQTYQAYAQAQGTILTTYNGYGQAQANIKQTYNRFAQAQADILQIYYGFAQVQARITQTYRGYGQAQAEIKQTYNGYGQAQSDIKQTYNGYGQSQADILQVYNSFAQAQARILQTYNAFAQAQATIKTTYNGYGQAQAQIKQTYTEYGQAQGSILTTYQSYGQAQADILQIYFGFAQTQAVIVQTYNQFAQAQGTIKATNNGFSQAQAQMLAFGVKAYGQAQGNIAGESSPSGQAQAYIIAFDVEAFAQSQGTIKATYQGYGQTQGSVLTAYQAYANAQADILKTYEGFAQAQAWIKTTYNQFAQSQADIKVTTNQYGQSQGTIKATYVVCAQAQANIKVTSNSFGQANADILQTYNGFGQAQGSLKATVNGYGQAQSDVKQTYQSYAQAQALIGARNVGCGQAQASIKAITQSYGQATADILVIYNRCAQAQAEIKQTYQSYAQAQAYIILTQQGFAQAQADIKATYKVCAQAQALVRTTNIRCAQAQARIKQTYQGYAQAQAHIIKSAQGYGQAQSQIQSGTAGYANAQGTILVTTNKYANAQGYISTTVIVNAQAQALIASKTVFAQAQAYIHIDHILKKMTLTDRASLKMGLADKLRIAAVTTNKSLDMISSDRRSIRIDTKDRA